MTAVLLVALAGCSNDAADNAPTGEGIVLRVTQAQTVAEWTLDQLAAEVPRAAMDLDGQAQDGYLLLDVLEASGVAGWDHGEVTGKGEDRAFDVVLDIDAAEVDEGWILDVTNQGTLKLAADDLPRERWVRDVSEIVVE